MSIKPWRVNYAVTYQNSSCVVAYRKSVLEILQNVALLRGIDYAVELDHQFFYERVDGVYKDLREYVSDILYFRSSQRSEISVQEFRKLIHHIFDNYQIVGLHPFEVTPLPQKDLSKYPFPKVQTKE